MYSTGRGSVSARGARPRAWKALGLVIPKGRSAASEETQPTNPAKPHDETLSQVGQSLVASWHAGVRRIPGNQWSCGGGWPGGPGRAPAANPGADGSAKTVLATTARVP